MLIHLLYPYLLVTIYEQVSDASLDLNETIMAPIRASVRNLFNSLAKKAKSWQRVPFADNTTVSLSRSVTILIFMVDENM